MTIKDKKIPEPSLRRLPFYHSALKNLRCMGYEFVSCTHISKEVDLLPIQIRKDLNYTGVKGYPKKGYKLEELVKAIELYLGWDNLQEAFLVGVGNLGRALLSYHGFENLGFKIIAGFDSSVKRFGQEINGIKVLPMNELEGLIRRMEIEVGIITTPWETAQDVADCMIKSGIKAIWNFAPIKLKVPEDILVLDENLASSLAVLTHSLKK